MEDNYYLQQCNDNDVLSFQDQTYKVSKFKAAVNKSFDYSMGGRLNGTLTNQGIDISSASFPNSDYAKWFNEGIDCEILNLGSKTWKKGKIKIKISIEFYTEAQEDEQPNNTNQPEITPPESPLDDLRQLLNQNNPQ